METARPRRSSQVLEEERKTRTRRMSGRCQPQWLMQQLSWTARCAPRVDKYWPPKTSTPINPCTSETTRSSLPCSQLAESLASLSFFICSCEENLASADVRREVGCLPRPSGIWAFYCIVNWKVSRSTVISLKWKLCCEVCINGCTVYTWDCPISTPG